jgi:hypothetical protein
MCCQLIVSDDENTEYNLRYHKLENNSDGPVLSDVRSWTPGMGARAEAS